MNREYEDEVLALKLEGKRPPVPDKFRKSKNPITKILLLAMRKCSRKKARDRPTAKELVEFLEFHLQAFQAVDPSDLQEQLRAP